MTIDQTKEIDIADDDVSEVPGLPEVKEGETIDWQKEAEKYKGIADRRTTKLSKLKNAPKPVETPKPEDQAPKNGELDYGQKAFLVANGFKDAEDHAFVQKTMKDSGQTLEQVLATPFAQAELKRLGEVRVTKAATPGPDDRNGAPARDKVEYWLAKGELPPNDGTPAGKKLREDYVNAKAARQKSGSVFTSTPVVQ